MKPHPKHRTARTVLLVAEMLGYGGMSTLVAETSSLLKKNGYLVHILTVTTHRNDAIFKKRFQDADRIYHTSLHSYHGLGNKLRIVLQTIRLFFRIIMQKKISLVVCVGPIATAALSLPLSVLRIPRLFFFISPLDLELKKNFAMDSGIRNRFGSLLYYWITRVGLSAFPTILTYSTYASRLLQTYYHVAKPIQIIPGFISPTRKGRLTLRTKSGVRKRFGIPQSGFVFLFPSRFEPWKQPERVLTALPYLTDSNYTIVFSGYADHAHKEKWLSWIRARNLKNHLVFLPHLPKNLLSELYQASDCVLFPSVNLEMFGYVALEAFTYGRPVLGSNEGAIPELLTKVDPRLIIPSPDPLVFAKKMQWMMRLSSHSYRKLSKRCTEVAATFNKPSATADFLALIDRTITGKTPQGSSFR